MSDELFTLPQNPELVMPAEFYGEMKQSCGYTDTDPRRWTKPELEWVKARVADGYAAATVAEAIGRTYISVRIKLKRDQKRNDTYNAHDRALKYAANELFVQTVKPKSVLDVFAGNSYYKTAGIDRVVTNDKDEKFETDFHEDALKVLCGLYAAGEKFDVIDLDPYGSAYDCFDLALKMAKRGLVVSFGEWNHRRWKRYDYVRPRYGIRDVDGFTIQAFTDEVQRVAATNNKKATIADVLQYKNFLRVYFTLDRQVVTEQWKEEQ